MTQEITFGIALVGAVLGIINTWINMDKNRVKLRVKPTSILYLTGDKKKHISITVINLSSFPVTISGAGFKLRGTKEKGFILKPKIMDGGYLPCRLETHSSLSIISDIIIIKEDFFYKVRCAFAQTDCGILKTGTSKFLKDLVKEEKAKRRS